MDEMKVIDEATPEDEAEVEAVELTGGCESPSHEAWKDRHIIYQDKQGEWRWRRVAANNKIIATSGEGYKNLNHCFAMVRRMCEGASVNKIHFEG